MSERYEEPAVHPAGPLPPGPQPPLRAAFHRLRDWTWENYQRAYLGGTAILTLGLALASGLHLRHALWIWAGVVVFGALVEPCINPQNERYGKMLWRGDPELKEVALTFDDGPWPPYTEQILDVLAEEGVPAAFFLVGKQVRLYPELVHRIRTEGHLIGNHTDTHQNLLLASPAASRAEIERGAEAIEAVLGEPPRWFRPPWGFRSPVTLRQAREAGQKVALWTFDPRDWQRPHPHVLTRRVVDACVPGTVVLLHDGNGDRSSTVAALPYIIRELRGLGYRFVSLEEMDRPTRI